LSKQNKVWALKKRGRDQSGGNEKEMEKKNRARKKGARRTRPLSKDRANQNKGVGHDMLREGESTKKTKKPANEGKEGSQRKCEQKKNCPLLNVGQNQATRRGGRSKTRNNQRGRRGKQMDQEDEKRKIRLKGEGSQTNIVGGKKR